MAEVELGLDTQLEQLAQAAAELGFNGYCVSISAGATLTHPERFMRCSDPAWISAYHSLQLHHRDPVMYAARRSPHSFNWKNRSRSIAQLPEQAVVLHEAGEFGYRNGLTMPFHRPLFGLGVLSLTTDVEDFEIADCPQAKLREIRERMIRLIETVEEHWAETRPEPPQLSFREVECLQWAALGKSSCETAFILGLSDGTVRFHLERSKRKLAAKNKPQAIVKALAHGLIVA